MNFHYARVPLVELPIAFLKLSQISGSARFNVCFTDLLGSLLIALIGWMSVLLSCMLKSFPSFLHKHNMIDM